MIRIFRAILTRSLENEICDYVDYFRSINILLKIKNTKKLIFFYKIKFILKI